MRFIKIIDRKYNMVELPCGKVTNTLDITQLDMNNEIGNFIVRYNNEQEIIKEWENKCKLELTKYEQTNKRN